jgi:hypothetical protein
MTDPYWLSKREDLNAVSTKGINANLDEHEKQNSFLSLWG